MSDALADRVGALKGCVSAYICDPQPWSNRWKNPPADNNGISLLSSGCRQGHTFVYVL